jgi:hypothetical protein
MDLADYPQSRLINVSDNRLSVHIRTGITAIQHMMEPVTQSDQIVTGCFQPVRWCISTTDLGFYQGYFGNQLKSKDAGHRDRWHTRCVIQTADKGIERLLMPYPTNT